MPKAFNYQWTVRVGTKELASGLYGETCRDSAMVTLGNLLDNAAEQLATTASKPFFRMHPMRVRRHYLIVNHHDSIRIDGIIAHNTTTPASVVDKVIEILSPMFPTVSFAHNTQEDAVTLSVWPGIVLSGNTDVVEAWYWAALLLRAAAVYNAVDPVVFAAELQRCIETNMTGMYYNATDATWHGDRWSKLPGAIVKPGWHLLMYGAGSGPRVATMMQDEIRIAISFATYQPGNQETGLFNL